MIFTLLLASNRKCADCFNLATHIFLGKENEFLGFYCQEHGEKLRDAFEDKYKFEAEKKIIKPVKRIKRNYLSSRDKKGLRNREIKKALDEINNLVNSIIPKD